MGVMAAFIFAAQMVNFPVLGGTSGHFMGGVLAAVLLGPFMGVLIMTTVLIVQCLVFQDGGITALGANVFNMGLVGVLGGYAVYTVSYAIMKRFNSRSAMAVSAFGAGWCSIVLASAACAVELAVSGVMPLRAALVPMAGIHAVIGIGEGVITVLVLGFVAKLRPDLLSLRKI